MTAKKMWSGIRRIEAFIAVAEELSFTRAAERLKIAQQPLSAHVARLEAEMGVRLVDRNPRRIALTEAGRVAYTDLLDVLARIESMQKNAVRAERGEVGRLSVAGGSYAVESILPFVLRAFHEQFPNVAVDLREGHTAEQIDSLARGEIDVAFAIIPPVRDGLNYVPIHEAGFVVARSSFDGAADSGTPIPLAAFRDSNFLAVHRHLSPGLDDLKSALFEDANFTPQIARYATQPSSILAYVAAGMGIFLTPEKNRRTSHPGVQYVAIASPRRAVVSMVTRNTTTVTAALMNFCSIAQQVSMQNHWLLGVSVKRRQTVAKLKRSE